MAIRWRYSGVGLSSLLLLWSSLFLCQCVPTATARRVHHHDSTDHSDQEVDLRDVISVRISHDGLRELRVSFHGVLLLETSRVSQQGDRDSSGEHVPVRLLQVTDGRQVVQHVQQGEVTRDCSVSRDWVDVLDFVEHYLHGVPRHAPHGDVMAVYRNATRARQSLPRSSRRTSTSSSVKSPRRDRRTKLGRRGVSMHVRGPGSLGRFARYLHVRQQARQCRKFLSLARHRAQASEDSGVPPPSVSQSARDSADGTEPTPVSLSQSSDSSGGVDSTSGQRFSSHSRQHSGSERSRETQSADSVTEAGPREEQGSLVHSRQKRDLLSGWFIFPGTKWCGDGDIAEHGDDLGYDEELDSCCREHDRCKHVIPRVSWRYSLFNYRLHTMSHCRCDRIFRKCLKKSTSPAAHMVGKIYFNVIGPQCFKFTKSRTCKRRNWWGKCKKYGFSKVAHPKKQRSF